MTPADKQAAESALSAGEPDEAASLCSNALNDNPDDAVALYILGRAMSQAHRYGVAMNLYRRVLDLHPNDSGSWNNLGYACHTLGRYDEAESHFKKSLSLEPANWHAYNNLTSLMAARIRPQEALNYAKYALFFAGNDDERETTRDNMALSQLGLRQWRDGWKNFEYGLKRSNFRRERQYAKEGRWDGRPGGRVVFYGEQGIGDEILFASMLPDALAISNGIIECDRRLEGLFKRTFPEAIVYGTRHDKEISWPCDDIHARCAFGSLGKFFRNDDASFPRKPYLVTCPHRRKMYRTLLDTLPGKKIGIAWTGGTKITRTADRSLLISEVETLARERYDVSLISLEYKDTGHAKGVHAFPFITRTADYDDTAALVAELDGVISVTTAVALLAGAVGTRCHVLVPSEPTWHWGYVGEMPWLELTLHRAVVDRQWDLADTLDALMGEIDGIGTTHARPSVGVAAQ